jgi:hypothetical protein
VLADAVPGNGLVDITKWTRAGKAFVARVIGYNELRQAAKSG